MGASPNGTGARAGSPPTSRDSTVFQNACRLECWDRAISSLLSACNLAGCDGTFIVQSVSSGGAGAETGRERGCFLENREDVRNVVGGGGGDGVGDGGDGGGVAERRNVRGIS